MGVKKEEEEKPKGTVCPDTNEKPAEGQTCAGDADLVAETPMPECKDGEGKDEAPKCKKEGSDDVDFEWKEGKYQCPDTYSAKKCGDDKLPGASREVKKEEEEKPKGTVCPDTNEKPAEGQQCAGDADLVAKTPMPECKDGEGKDEEPKCEKEGSIDVNFEWSKEVKA